LVSGHPKPARDSPGSSKRHRPAGSHTRQGPPAQHRRASSINIRPQHDVTTENKIVVSLKEYITRHDLARRKSSTPKPSRSRRQMREDVGEVRVMSSPGLDTASVGLPAGRRPQGPRGPHERILARTRRVSASRRDGCRPVRGRGAVAVLDRLSRCPRDVRYASDSDQILRRSEMTRSARRRLMHRNNSVTIR
jgi:hypothetical protein